MADRRLRTWLQRSIMKALRDGLTGITVQQPGRRDDDVSGLEEWVAFAPIQDDSWLMRKGVFGGMVTFQVSCFSRFAEDRSDGQTDAPMVLSGKVRAILDDAGILIRSYGEDPVSDIGCLQLGTGSEVYLDERRLGVIGPDASTASSVHAVALTYRGAATAI